MTDIQWTDVVWNPTVGCSRVSAGCEHCYAETFAHRGLTKTHRGLTVAGSKGPRWTGEVRLVPEAIAKPLRWRKPRRIFVNSMSDLFHERVPFEYVAAVFAVMAACPQHTFQVLTKRPARMLEFFEWVSQMGGTMPATAVPGGDGEVRFCVMHADEHEVSRRHIGYPVWPLPNVWLGVSAEHQQAADERIPLLLECPAAVRWVSAEPLLGAIRFDRVGPDELGMTYDALRGAYGGESGGAPIDWVVVGGESGGGARPCALEWIESIVDQCRNAGTAIFVKQLGACVVSEDRVADGKWAWRAGHRDRKGGDPSEWPSDLRVREWPSCMAAGGTP